MKSGNPRVDVNASLAAKPIVSSPTAVTAAHPATTAQATTSGKRRRTDAADATSWSTEGSFMVLRGQA